MNINAKLISKPTSIKAALTCLMIIAIFISVFYYATSTYCKNEKIEIVYFYMNPCESCNTEGIFLEKFNKLRYLKGDGSNVSLKMYNTMQLGADSILSKYFEQYKVPKDKRNTPIVFVGNYYIIGESEIDSRLEEVFLKVK